MIRNNLISYEGLPLSRLDYDERNYGGIIGTSDCNEYVPFYCIGNHNLIDVNGHRIIEYGKPVFRTSPGNTRNYNDLFRNLSTIGINYIHSFTVAGVSHQLGYNRNIIFDSNNKVLICLAVKTEALLNNSFAQLQANQNPSDYILLVNNELFSNPSYKNVAKKIDSVYISQFRQSNIDLVFTNDIDKWVFQNNFVKPDFKNVVQMMNHLNKEVPKILVMN